MNRLFLLVGYLVLWPSFALAGAEPEVIFEQGFENLPDAVEILSLTTNPASVFEGESITISWLLKDASSCTATDGTPEWRALSFDGSDGSFDIITLLSAGSFPFTLTCTGPVGDPAVDTVNVVITIPPPAQILSFLAEPDNIEVDESTTLSWTLQDAVSCTTSGGTTQWQALTIDGSDNSVEITDLDTAGVFQFALNCEGVAGDTIAAVAEVTVNALTCELPTLDAGVAQTWTAFWGEDFPDTVNSVIAQPINAGHYLSVQFNTADVVNNGRILTLDNPFTDGTRLGAVSRCFGRFDVPAECTHTWLDGQADTNGINWATDGKAGACVLKPNTNYFLNITFTDGIDSATDTCTTVECIASLQQILDPVDP